jgi:hypothetical protein
VLACLAGFVGSHARSSAASTPKPIRWGYSDPAGADLSGAAQKLLLNTTATLVGNGGYIRAPLHWDPTQNAVPNFRHYDGFVTQAWSRGLIWLPTIVTSTATSPITPQSAPGGLAAWQAALTAIVAHYGPGGTFAQANPGFPGITTYEIWNEPNTGTGNAIPGCLTCQMDPATIDQILATASSAIHQQAASMGFTAEVLGPGLGAIDLTYLDAMYTADPSVLSYMDVLSVHLYMNSDPATCTTTVWPMSGHCVLSLALLRSWIDSHTPSGTAAPPIAITEGGYSGSGDSCRPVNVMSFTDQANFETTAYDWIRAHPELGVTMIVPYQVIDAETQTYPCGTGYDPPYFIESLGAAGPMGALRPGGTAYQAIVNDARTRPFLSWPNAVVSTSTDVAGKVLVGHPTNLPPITLSNTGQATMPISSFGLKGLAGKDYSLATTCGAQLAIGSSCKITPRLRASVTGARPGTLTIIVNSVPSTFTVSLSGTGVQGDLQFSPATLAFPATVRNTSSKPLQMKVTNTGTAPATLTAITITGLNAPMFAVTQACPSVLRIGQSCIASVTFTPTTRGLKSAALTFKGDLPAWHQSAPLSGTGK